MQNANANLLCVQAHDTFRTAAIAIITAMRVARPGTRNAATSSHVTDDAALLYLAGQLVQSLLQARGRPCTISPAGHQQSGLTGLAVQPQGSQRVLLLETKVLMKTLSRKVDGAGISFGTKAMTSSNNRGKNINVASRRAFGPRPSLVLLPNWGPQKILFATDADFGNSEELHIMTSAEMGPYRRTPITLADSLQAWFDDVNTFHMRTTAVSRSLRQRMLQQAVPLYLSPDFRTVNWPAISGRFPRLACLSTLLRNLQTQQNLLAQQAQQNPQIPPVQIALNAQINLLELCRSMPRMTLLEWALAEFGLSAGAAAPTVADLFADIGNPGSRLARGLVDLIAAQGSKGSLGYQLLNHLINNKRRECTATKRLHDDGPLSELNQRPVDLVGGGKIGGFSDLYAMETSHSLKGKSPYCLACALTTAAAYLEMYDLDSTATLAHREYRHSGLGINMRAKPEKRLLASAIRARDLSIKNLDDLRVVYGVGISSHQAELHTPVVLMITEIIKQSLLDNDMADPVTGVPFKLNLTNGRASAFGTRPCVDHRHLEAGEPEEAGGLLVRLRGIVSARANLAIEVVGCLKEASEAFRIFNATRNLDFALPSTRALFLHHLLHENICDPWLEPIRDTARTFVDRALPLIQAATGHVGRTAADYCQSVSPAVHQALLSGHAHIPEFRALFDDNRVRAKSRPDFLDDAKQAQVLHYSHTYPCKLLFFTSGQFNIGEGNAGKADYETCRRLVAYWDRFYVPAAPAGPVVPPAIVPLQHVNLAQLAQDLVPPNLPFMQWAARTVLKVDVTNADLQAANITRPNWDNAVEPWIAGAVKPTAAQLRQAIGIDPRNQTTYEGVHDAMRFLWDAPGDAAQQIPAQNSRLADVRARWNAAGNAFNDGPENADSRFQRVVTAMTAGDVARTYTRQGAAHIDVTAWAQGDCTNLRSYLEAMKYDLKTPVQRKASMNMRAGDMPVRAIRRAALLNGDAQGDNGDEIEDEDDDVAINDPDAEYNAEDVENVEDQAENQGEQQADAEEDIEQVEDE